jgi:hypothetical protein
MPNFWFLATITITSDISAYIVSLIFYKIGRNRFSRIILPLLCALIFPLTDLYINIHIAGTGSITWLLKDPSTQNVATNALPLSMIDIIFTALLQIASFGLLFAEFSLMNTFDRNSTNDIYDCLYFSIITWTTVGFGDFVPHTKWARLLSAVEAVFGYFTMAALIGSMIALAAHT